MSNYATLHIKDAIARLDGVGDVQTFGARDYAMRIWLKLLNMAAVQRVEQLRHQSQSLLLTSQIVRQNVFIHIGAMKTIDIVAGKYPRKVRLGKLALRPVEDARHNYEGVVL